MENDKGAANSDQKRNKLRDYLVQARLVLLGSLLGAFFTGVVIYGEIKEQFESNRIMIDANKSQIERFWDAHEIGHQTANRNVTSPDP